MINKGSLVKFENFSVGKEIDDPYSKDHIVEPGVVGLVTDTAYHDLYGEQIEVLVGDTVIYGISSDDMSVISGEKCNG
jgi:hypothetical protein